MSGYGSSYARALQNRQAAFARAAAAQRMARIMKEAQSDAARLEIADKARQENDIETACRIYLSVAGSRLQTPAKQLAQQRLADLQQEARGKLDEVESRLAELGDHSPSDQNEGAADQLRQAIDQFEALARLYQRVPKIGREMRNALSKRMRDPAVRAVTLEPEAERLWQVGQQLEAEGQSCCAFQVYEEGARLLPAPSGLLAADRLAEMNGDATLVAAAEACRNLQWCHKTFDLAQQVARVKPERARELFEQVVARAPADSKVHVAARQQIADL